MHSSATATATATATTTDYLSTGIGEKVNVMATYISFITFAIRPLNKDVLNKLQSQNTSHSNPMNCETQSTAT